MFKKLFRIIMVAFLKFIGIVVYSIFAVILGGIVLVDLWAWFIVPVFHMGVLNIPQAIGISILVGYMTHQVSHSKQTESMANIFLVGFIRVLMAWGMGWIVHQFI